MPTPDDYRPIPPVERQGVWPFATALGLLGASTAGLVVTLSRGDEAPLSWYTNPWFWLGSLTILTLALSIALFLSHHPLGRRMQTAVLVSLVLHVLLAIYLKDQGLAIVLDEQVEPDLMRVEPVPTIPNYYLPAPNQTRATQPFERPSDASFQGQLSPLERTQATHAVDARPTPSNFKSSTAARPTEVSMRRQPMSAPRRARQMSLRRQQDHELAQRQNRRIKMPRSPETPESTHQATSAVPDTHRSPQRQEVTANLRQPTAPARRTDLQATSQPRQLTRSSTQRSAPVDTAIRSSSPNRSGGSSARLSSARAESVTSAPASHEYSRRTDQIAPSTENIARRAASRSAARTSTPRESAIPTAAAAPRVSGRRQVASRETNRVTMDAPSRSRAQGTIAETTADDVEPARQQRARITTATAEPLAGTLRRNSERGRPASRSRRSAAAAASDTSLTRGDAGRSALPRAVRPTSAAANTGSNARQRQRRMSAATANQLAAREIDGLPESRSAASPSTIEAETNVGAARQLARRDTAGPSGRGREGRKRRENADEISRANVSSLAGSRSDGAARPDHSTMRDAASGESGRQRSGPSRQPATARLGEANTVAESLAQTQAQIGGSDPGSQSGQSSWPSSNAMAGNPDDRSSDGNAAPSNSGLTRTRSALPTHVVAPVGAGGLGASLSANAGILDRRATPRSRVAHETPSRFLARTTGGRRSADLAQLEETARRATVPFAGRGARLRPSPTGAGDPTGAGAPTARTEAAIELGLEYLARIQQEDGRWSLQGSGDPSQTEPLIRADTAASGLALLTFLGAGYDHFEGKYQKEIAAGLKWVVQHQQANGDLYKRQQGPANQGIWLYSHGIASIVLCEAYGMTGDEQLKGPAQRALNFIVASQNRTYGGWRYSPGETPDLSVSGWQLMALRSGQLAGLEVPAETITRVRQLLAATSGGEGQFVYNPWSQHPRQGRVDRSPNSVMTSVGLLMRLYSGSGRRDAGIQQGAELLVKRLPNEGKSSPTRSMKNPNRDAYYWYNATQVMFHMQGEHWEAWRNGLYPLLTASQEKTGALSGSWDPFRPLPDRWAHHAGRLYVTTMNLLSLEVYYRHLPLYDDGLASQP
jgi:hypothetical protein